MKNGNGGTASIIIFSFLGWIWNLFLPLADVLAVTASRPRAQVNKIPNSVNGQIDYDSDLDSIYLLKMTDLMTTVQEYPAWFCF